MIKKLSSLLSVLAVCSTSMMIPVHAEESIIETTSFLLGDVNGDKAVNASDASEILVEAAMLGANLGSHFTNEQSLCADLDGSGRVDAADAAYVLMYAAVSGSGSDRTIADFMYQQLLPVSPDTLPEFAGEPYTIVNNGEPFFVVSDYDVSASFEIYSDLDSLGRCRIAFANVGQDIMPTEGRGNISSVTPTGWQSVTYDNVEGGYLYNRSHLIGFQLTGENANALNLITGTRYLNATGMLPFENEIAEYVKTTDHHVLYRVTPIFEDDNLLASGVLMEAFSVEDDGEGICFNVYCYNVQPGIVIDYASGNNWLEDGAASETSAAVLETTVPETTMPDVNTTAVTTETTTQTADTTTGTVTETTTATTYTPTTSGGLNIVDQSIASYIANTSTKKFHILNCSEVSKIKAENFASVANSKEELMMLGYTGCKRCNP